MSRGRGYFLFLRWNVHFFSLLYAHSCFTQHHLLQILSNMVSGICVKSGCFSGVSPFLSCLFACLLLRQLWVIWFVWLCNFPWGGKNMLSLVSFIFAQDCIGTMWFLTFHNDLECFLWVCEECHCNFDGEWTDVIVSYGNKWGYSYEENLN